ncbi:MAG: small ribosomal subunit Rsm22 family protein [Pseudonocardiaceae bacterium]
MTRSGFGRDALRAAIEGTLAGQGAHALAAGVQRLMAAYRSGEVPRTPVLASRRDVAAYAAYRMPATEAATRAALQQVIAALPGWAPIRLVDIGSGTGATAWAVAGELPSIEWMTLHEQSHEAIDVGRAILDESGVAVLRQALWVPWRLPMDGAVAPFPPADLATVGYVLGELEPQQRARLVALAMEAASVVVIVESGTPGGYRRVIDARAQLVAAGFTLLAPCPHQLVCPLTDRRDDWCHFAERVERSTIHRRAKGAQLPYEDEKFSFVAAVRDGDVDLPAARVIRHPQHRKGLVSLELCVSHGCARTQLVGKRYGPVYRQARKVSWGDRWDHMPGAAGS